MPKKTSKTKKSKRGALPATAKKGPIKLTKSESGWLTELNERHHEFIDEYLISSFNARKAYEKVYQTTGKDTALRGYALLKDPLIKAELEKKVKERRERYPITEEFILTNLFAIAGANVPDLYDDEGNLRPFSEWSEESKIACAEIQTTQTEFGVVVKTKQHSKMEATKLLARHLGMELATDKVQVDTIDLAERMRRARERAKKK